MARFRISIPPVSATGHSLTSERGSKSFGRVEGSFSPSFIAMAGKPTAASARGGNGLIAARESSCQLKAATRGSFFPITRTATRSVTDATWHGASKVGGCLPHRYENKNHHRIGCLDRFHRCRCIRPGCSGEPTPDLPATGRVPPPNVRTFVTPHRERMGGRYGWIPSHWQ